MTDTPIKGSPRVFVYGSLKQNHSNSGLLCTYNLLGRAYIEGPYRMMSLGFFPGVTKSALHTPDARIYGEVYVVDGDGLASLDLLEGHPHFYQRLKVKTNVEDFGNVWCYFLNAEHNPQRAIPDGLWRPTEEERAHWTVEGELAPEEASEDGAQDVA